MLFKYIFGSLKQIGTDVKQNTQGITALQEQVAKMKTEVDTEKFEHLTNHTIYEIQQQIRYLKQPPIVLKIIIGLTIVALIATCATGYYIRDRREWKDTAKYWYEQSQQNVLSKAKKKQDDRNGGLRDRQ